MFFVLSLWFRWDFGGQGGGNGGGLVVPGLWLVWCHGGCCVVVTGFLDSFLMGCGWVSGWFLFGLWVGICWVYGRFGVTVVRTYVIHLLGTYVTILCN